MSLTVRAARSSELSVWPAASLVDVAAGNAGTGVTGEARSTGTGAVVAAVVVEDAGGVLVKRAVF